MVIIRNLKSCYLQNPVARRRDSGQQEDYVRSESAEYSPQGLLQVQVNTITEYSPQGLLQVQVNNITEYKNIVVKVSCKFRL